MKIPFKSNLNVHEICLKVNQLKSTQLLTKLKIIIIYIHNLFLTFSIFKFLIYRYNNNFLKNTYTYLILKIKILEKLKNYTNNVLLVKYYNRSISSLTINFMYWHNYI